jgi:hypothetical protein
MSLVRIVHISDLHIGSGIAGGGIVPRATKHDLRALEAFVTVRNDLARDAVNIPTGLVMSGDATAHGHPNDLSTYCTIRDIGFVVSGQQRLFPLTQGFSWTLDIPGNHDFWSGKILNPRLNPIVRSHYFDESKWSQQLETEHWLVAFHGLCSTSGAGWAKQVMAVGDFLRPQDVTDLTNRFRTADAAAQSAGKRLLNLIVTHHSPTFGSPSGHGMAQQALQDLDDFHRQHGAHGILTGHSHTQNIVLGAALRPEVRCSTTTQANLRYGAKQSREFVLHEFKDLASTALEWSATAWVFDQTQFKPDGRSPHIRFP